jgi:hypothetical protein
MSSAPPHALTPCNTPRAVRLSVTGGTVSWCGASGRRRMAATAVRAADCPEPGPDFRGLRGAVGGAGPETVGVGRPNVLTPESVVDHQAPSE